MSKNILLQTNHRMQQCMQNCVDCHWMCLETVTYCLQNGGKLAESPHIQLLLDCADICQTSANFMIRVSDLHQHTCDVCAIVCAHCAEDCNLFSDDLQMQTCVEVARRCAISCRQMATAV